jgi:hypothetical protein
LLQKRPELPFWLSLGATALLVLMGPPARETDQRRVGASAVEKEERPFGEPRSSEEPHDDTSRRLVQIGASPVTFSPLEQRRWPATNVTSLRWRP